MLTVAFFAAGSNHAVDKFIGKDVIHQICGDIN
jgi:hypothetical protein